MNNDAISDLGHRAERFAEATQLQMERLRHLPLTRHDFLLGLTGHGIDFKTMDALRGELDAACVTDADTPYTAHGGTMTLRSVSGFFTEVEIIAARYRNARSAP